MRAITHRAASSISKALSLNTAGAIALCALLTACGNNQKNPKSSELEWIRSRPQSDRYAFLTSADLNDTFLFGASVIKVDHFLSNALNMTIRPLKIRLFLEEESQSASAKKLQIKIQDGGRWHTVLSFDANLTEGQPALNSSFNSSLEKLWEIDFASSGNDLAFNQLIDTVGGMHTAMHISGRWISQAAPQVLKVSQDDDTVVIDLLHTVKQSGEGLEDAEDPAEASSTARTSTEMTATDSPADQTGLVTVRIWLKRQVVQPDLSKIPTVDAGTKLNIGFFGSNLVPAPQSVVSSPIQHFVLPAANTVSPKITFYLKDFPPEFFEVGKAAVLSWNQAFDHPVLDVAKAPAGVDAGDPRFHYIKWFDGTDQNLPWAGVAKMLVDPDSGVVMSGGVYIQGNTLVELYRKIHSYSEQASRGVYIQGNTLVELYRKIHSYSEQASRGGLRTMQGSLGRASFEADWGEAPIVPYFTDVKANFASYIREYYLETIAHEVGHVLGLRHNFKGSTQLRHKQAASVMDYLPRAQRANFRGPGFYDIAAIRWAYYGEKPTEELPFCTDDQLWQQWNCNQGDYGEASAYVLKGLYDGTQVLAQKPIEVSDSSFIASMVTTAENAFKLWKLKTQLPPLERQKVEIELPKAMTFLYTVEPAEWLSEDEKAIVRKNLKNVRQLIRAKEAQLRSTGTL